MLRGLLPLLLLLPAASLAQFPVSVDASGCRIERLVSGDGRSYHQFHGLAPDGRTLVVGWETVPPESSARGAFLLNLETGARVDLPGLNNAASFAPDGRTVVSGFHTGSSGLRTEIVEYDLTTHQFTFLAPDSTGDWLPTYSRDGRSVIFNSYRTGGSDLYRLDRATRSLERLTSDDRYEAHAQVSPDGARIAFHRRVRDTDYAIMFLDAATGAVAPLVDTPAEESYAAWSPDGRYLAFSSNRDNDSGDMDLYVAAIDGGAVQRLTSSAGNDTYADWSPDGRYIYFNSGRGRERGTDVYRMPIRGTGCQR